jgi:glycerate dehydrogenase
MRGVFLDLNSVDRDDLDLTGFRGCLEDWRLHARTVAGGEVAERITGAEVVVSNKVMLDAAALKTSPDLQLICVAATGTNNVDLQAARQQGITVCNARDYATPSVVQHVFALILSLTIQLPRYQQAVQQGHWQRSEQFCLLDYPISELAGKTLGIIGYGVLGHAVAQAAQAFGMQVIIADHKGRSPRQGRVAFEQLLRTADVITLHCPLTPETQGLIGSTELDMMKSTAFLINAARGGIVDEQALVDALQQGFIGGAGVDTLTKEPPMDGNPLLEAGLSNLIVTPHIAWASRESRQRLLDDVENNIRAFRAGTPRNIVAL